MARRLCMRCGSPVLRYMGRSEVQQGVAQKSYECRDCGEVNVFDVPLKKLCL